MDSKLLLAAILLSAAVCVNSTPDTWLEGNKFLESFRKQMEEAASHLEGLVENDDRSREELEDDDKNAKNPDDDEDEEPNRKTPSVDDDSDEDDDDFSSVLQSFPSFFNILRNPAMKPWWDGPNVCVERDVKETEPENKTESSSGDNFFIFGSAQFSSCKHSPNKYSCTTVVKEGNGKTKTSTVTYQCCHGYRRAPGKPGCSKVDTKSLSEMADEEGCSQFAEMLKSAGLTELKSQNITLFAPTDKAMASYQSEEGDSFKGGIFTNEVVDDTKSVDSGNKQVLLSHLVTGLIVTDEMFNDKVVYSLNDNSSVRINVFPSRRGATVTVNCARINQTDRISTEGVVHTIDRILRPVTKSLMDILNEPNYSQFKKLLEDNNLLNKLEGVGPFTVFALTNQALEKMDSSKMCLRRILEHHILPHTVCSEAARDGKISALDLVSDWLKLEMTDDEELILDGEVKATRTDIQATNGVIHEVDSFIIPSAAKSATELLRSTNHTQFLEMLEKSGMGEVINNLEDVTLFVPSERGLAAEKDNIDSLTPEELKQLVSYHIIPQKLSSGNLKNNEKIPTLDDNKELRVSIVNNILTGLAGLGTRALVQCSPVTRIDGDVCNGIVHEILNPANPPNQTIFESITSRSDLEKFRQVLEGTKLEEELKGGKLNDITLLAPTAEAFQKMGSGNLEILMKDKDLADQILRNHILKGMVCCTGIGSSSWPFLAGERTLSGSMVETNRSFRTRRVTFAGVTTNTCDLAHTDGLIHTLDGVILPAGHRHNTDIVVRRPHSDIILTGL